MCTVHSLAQGNEHDSTMMADSALTALAERARLLGERKLVEMRDGRGSGFFALPDTLYSGFFELRAYTRWQLNWG